ncbi:TRAP transporter substrate-binding protein [Alteribacillus sp. YIM 98480]|uniref:TRAP transporter substrate-binding protein n=1 Tax=Alteribacillus sp. YIM 98480 TaxID=2606599 RepID=UPI00131B95BE|nr:TRAP transporter substrate-binding protein DctP [Alteribacillus sp. YIM 98480]
MKCWNYKFIFITIAAVLFSLAGCGSNQTSESSSEAKDNGNNNGQSEEVDIQGGLWIPGTHPVVTEGFEPWAEYVQEETEGSVNIDIQSGSVLGESTQVIKDVSGGAYDLGVTVGQFYPDTPLFKMTILDLPFAFVNTDDHAEITKVVRRYVDEKVKEDFEEMGLKFLGAYTTDPAVIISSEPIHTVEDLQNKRTLLQAPSWEPILNEWGATPVSMAIEDLYTALDRGTVDVGIYAIAGSYSQKLHEPAPYYTNIPISTVAGSAFMNLEKFNTLSPELQQQFEEEFNPKIAELLRDAYTQSKKESLEKITEEIKGKGEIIEPSDEQIQEFVGPAKDVWNNWINEADEKGYNGQELMDEFLNIMEEEGIEPPFEL